MSVELLNCPFCGGEAAADCIKDSSFNHVECNSCGARSSYNSKAKGAITAWNTRAALAAPASCAWTCNDDPDDSCWTTACGEAFFFNDDGPAEHDFKHCCYCGGALVVAPLAGPVEQGEQG